MSKKVNSHSLPVVQLFSVGFLSWKEPVGRVCQKQSTPTTWMWVYYQTWTDTNPLWPDLIHQPPISLSHSLALSPAPPSLFPVCWLLQYFKKTFRYQLEVFIANPVSVPMSTFILVPAFSLYSSAILINSLSHSLIFNVLISGTLVLILTITVGTYKQQVSKPTRIRVAAKNNSTSGALNPTATSGWGQPVSALCMCVLGVIAG